MKTCLLHEELEGKGDQGPLEQGGQEGLCASKRGISFMQICIIQNEKLHL